MIEIKSGTITPIRPFTSHIAVVILEIRLVELGGAVGKGKADRRLLGPDLTDGVGGSDGSPIVGSVIIPIGGIIYRVVVGERLPFA